MSSIHGLHPTLTKRTKFKSPSEVEVTVLDMTTQEEWQLHWNFRDNTLAETERQDLLSLTEALVAKTVVKLNYADPEIDKLPDIGMILLTAIIDLFKIKNGGLSFKKNLKEGKERLYKFDQMLDEVLFPEQEEADPQDLDPQNGGEEEVDND